MKKYKRLTKEKLLKTYNICRLEHEALMALADSGKTIFKRRIDVVVRQYVVYLHLLKQYAVVRRRKIRRDSKNELTDSGRKTR